MRTPTDAEFRAIVNGNDEAVISIRGHVAIEAALSEVIAQALPAAHEIELERISFPLKIDLAIALKAIRPESRPLLVVLNRVRNRFAHEASATLEESDFAEIRNSMSAIHRSVLRERFDSAKTPRDALRLGAVAAFYEARGVTERLVAQKIEHEELAKEVAVLLEKTKRYANHPAAGEFTEKVQKRVKERLAQREAPPSASPDEPNKTPSRRAAGP
jgi:hypothetical protein